MKCRGILSTLLLLSGCEALPLNSSFQVDSERFAHDSSALKKDRRALQRPLVILGGFYDPGVGPLRMKWALGNYVADDRLLLITFFNRSSLEECKAHAVEAIAKRFGTNADGSPVEVDVIGISMGGLVAVYSAGELGEHAINAKRIFTMSSPLCGSHLARRVHFTISPLHRDMRPGSALYAKLAAASEGLEIYSYTRLDDPIVGAEFAALPGRTPWWLANEPLQSAHYMGTVDARFVLDVAKRLRNEPAYGTFPATAVP